MAYVISKNNKALMPCTNVIARLLLKQKKAKVIKKTPFTIKLNYETTNYTQDLILGVDTGSGILGTAVSNENNEIVYLSEVILRNDITDKMKRRASYRRNRRYRKTRYRKARWLNRKNSTKNDRFSPTIQSKFHTHIKEIEYIKTILPITDIVLETGQFDTHLMKNPSLSNENIKHWGYQKGQNYGFDNTKAMVLNRDNYTCQHCKGKHKDSKLEVHHIIFRCNNGSDEADNLITLCHTCHKALHDKKIKLDVKGKTKGTLKYATQMNSIRVKLLKTYSEAIETFGFITKLNRLMLGIDKEHYYDACVISTGGKNFSVKCVLLKKKCISKGDFQQTKGVRSEQKIPTGKISGFKKFDKVLYLKKEYFIKGRMSSGYALLMNIEGQRITFNDAPKGFKTPKTSNLKRLEARKSWIVSSTKII